MITGFYACDLARRGKKKEAQRFVEGIHQANAMAMDGESWGFAEYVHGSELKPRGTKHQGWSAAAAVIGQQTLKGQSLFRIGDL
jgi:hypothetical protein